MTNQFTPWVILLGVWAAVGAKTKLRRALSVGAVMGLVALCLFPQSARATEPPPFVRPSALGPGLVPSGAVALGALEANQPLQIEVVVPPSNERQLQSTLAALYDPASSEYHQWLGAGQFDAEFGPSPATVASVEAWLHAKGLTSTSVSGFSVRAAAPAGAVAAALGTSFERYRSPDGVTGYLASQAPLIPAALAGGQISAILGLNTLARFTSQSTQVTPKTGQAHGAGQLQGSVQPGGAAQPDADGLNPCSAASGLARDNPGMYTLDTVGADYGVDSLLHDGLKGRGQTVAVYELAPHSESDVTAYESCFGLTNPVSAVEVDGGGTVNSDGTFEADLDIEQVATQAPDASIISYEGPNTEQGAADTWAAIVDADQANVISSSWGECEEDAQDEISTFSTDFEQAAMQGETVLAASGDDGSEGCLASDGTAGLDPEYPASDPSVTGVGGTTLYGPDDEIVWNDGDGAGGGGLSYYEPPLSYQPKIAYWAAPAPCGGKYCREVPDISANAGSPMVVYYNGGWTAGVGTSFAAPFVAGVMADKNVGCTTSTGNFTPSLYALYDKGVYGTALNEITEGNNDFTHNNGGEFPAEPNYNLATGVGSPIASGLACPEVTSVVPAKAPIGSDVVVDGLGLEKATITFGAAVAKVVSASATAATVVVPSGSATATVKAKSVLGTGTLNSSFTFEPALPPPCPTTKGVTLSDASGITSVMIGSCPGYYVTNSAGQVSASGAAVFHGDLSGTHLNAPIIAITATPNGGGYWLLGADGGVFSFGNAAFYGSTGGMKLNAPVVGMAVTPTNGGYWIVAQDGGVFSFGNATFHGSTGGMKLNQPVDGIAVAPGGNGYWLVASDGGVFTFTPDGFYGSLGSTHLNKPIIGMSSTPNGKGYTLVGSDGGVFSFGDAPFYGSLGSDPPTTPVVDLSPTPSDNGYYLVDSGGGVFGFGPGADYLAGA